jgi:uncharacterized membrane protein
LRIKIGNELLPLNLLVILLIVAIIFTPSVVLRIVLGLPFVFFFPGYALTAALFPKREGLGGIERIALSFGMSIAVVALIGLILNYTWWGITLESTLYSVASFIFLVSIIAWVRRKRLPEEERFDINFQLRLPGWGWSAWDTVLSVVLVVAILGALGMLGYAIATPKVGERFTEFYILGTEGKAADYPQELTVGEEGKVIVGIVNREHERVSYHIEVMIDNAKNNEVGPIELEHDEKWEGIAVFTSNEPGKDQKVEFLLYKNGEVEPSVESLYLWIDVNQ